MIWRLRPKMVEYIQQGLRGEYDHFPFRQQTRQRVDVITGDPALSKVVQDGSLGELLELPDQHVPRPMVHRNGKNGFCPFSFEFLARFTCRCPPAAP